MIILVDVDDVTADLVPSWLDEYNKQYDDNLKVEDITVWDIASLVKTEAKDKFFDIINNHRFYYNVQPVPGAYEGIIALRQMGHRVIFATSAMVGHAGDKLRWLQHNRFLDTNKFNDPDYMEITDKTLIKADLIIDDRVGNVMGFVNAGKCAIVFTKPWNLDLASDDECVFRANDWQEVVRLVKTISEKPSKENPLPQMVKDQLLESGVKFDHDKPRWDLLPWEAIGQIVGVMTLGAKKYAEYNWAKGMHWSRVYAALLRHLTAWFGGEDLDKETGLSHLAHAGCCLLFLMSYQLWGGKYNSFDNRPFRMINEWKKE